MPRIPERVPVSELRQDTANILRRVRTEPGPIVITQRGKAAAVLLSVEEYERDHKNRALMEVLARGDREIAAGVGFELDHVLGDVDAMLAQ